MIRYGLGDYEITQEDWAKHHKEISIRFKREYEDGREPSVTESEDILKLVEQYPDKVIKKAQSLFERDTFKSLNATDHFIVLTNLDYPESKVDYYSVGSSNTSHVTKVRLRFRLEYADFMLDYEYKTSGSYAMSFYSLINNSIDDIVEEVACNDDIPFTKKGIMPSKELEGYYIVAVDENKRNLEFDIETKELLSGLVGVEVYQHDTKIDD